ncbi:MAG: DegV family protein [Chloroflexi bacterium]|nr:DegV family protein [Chloroflexota bacterium]
MSRIAIITDTDSSLPLELAKKHGIVQVPIIIQFGDESFRDVEAIDNETLFTRIDKDGKLPTTAAPSPGQFAESFKAAFASGADEILCLNISSEMSATYTSARQAAEMFDGKRIEVMDTRSLCIGQGYMVLAAADVAARGGSMEEAIKAGEEIRERTYLFGALTTLKYIAMSGRVSSLAAGMAGLLDIKPILSLQNGKLSLLEKVRTQGKSWTRAIELCDEKRAGRKIEKMAIVNVKCPDSARLFETQIRAALPCPDEILHTDVNPGLSVHTGAGMVAVAFTTAE